MTEKTQNNLDKETDLFDKQLDAFIQSCSDDTYQSEHLDTEEKNGKTFPFIPFIKEGFEYMIPAYSASSYTFQTAKFLLYGKDLMQTTEKGKNFVCLSGVISPDYLELENLSSVADDSDNKDIYVFLYKKKRKKAMYKWRETPYDNDVYFDFPSELRQLPAGEYFLLITNIVPPENDIRFEKSGNHTIFSFRILPNGSKLSHPQIQNIHIHYPMKNKIQTSGIVTITSTFTKKPGKWDEFRLRCYNQSLFLMGESLFTASPEFPGQRNIKIPISSPFIWMPGKYCCIVEHNNEPFYKIDFQLSSNTEEYGQGNIIPQNSSEYLMAKHLENDETYKLSWTILRKITGHESVKRKALEYYRYTIFNRLRKKANITEIHRNMNFICETEGAEADPHLLKCFANIACGFSNFTSVDAETLTEPKNAVDPYEDTTELLSDIKDNVICLNHIRSLISENGNVILSRFKKKLQTSNNWALFITGTQSEINLLFERFPDIASFFPPANRIKLSHLNSADAIHYMQRMLKAQGLFLSPEAETFLVSKLIAQKSNGDNYRWDKKRLEEFINDGIIPLFQRRIFRENISANKLNAEELSSIKPEDIDIKFFQTSESCCEESMKELNSMTGLSNIKQTISSMINQIKFNAVRNQMGLSHKIMGSHHMIFTGNPGTGKTTVAKMLGKIFHALGLLSKGDVIVTERSRIVGRFIGETERNMQAILTQAQGNILFIDEAYTLCDSADDRKDYGHRVIESLLTVLSQKEPDMIIILAGYETEMMRLLESNTGLKGRFPYTFRFNDYTADELMQIAYTCLRKENYELTEAAGKHLLNILKEKLRKKDKNFSNARWIEQYIHNGIIPAMADRVIESGQKTSPESYRLIEQSDVETAYQQFHTEISDTAHKHAPIGFRR